MPIACPPCLPSTSLLRGQVVSRAKDVFASLRSYPNNAQDIASTKQLLQSIFERLHEAGHAIFLRLISPKQFKVGAAHQQPQASTQRRHRCRCLNA